MKLVLFFLVFSGTLWARPLVLLSYFDPFGGARVNNSETVARALLEKAQQETLPFELKLCKVQTKFDVSHEELKDCLNGLPERPLLVLGLGETGCNLKLELMARNLDKTRAPDNAGVERRNTPIVPGAPRAIGLTYPVAQMYCALEPKEQKLVVISSNAGSFVCNNLAFQTSWFETDLFHGFIHVPMHTCRNLTRINEGVVGQLQKMITRGVEVAQKSAPARLPVFSEEFDRIRSEIREDPCEERFWERARAFDD